MEATNIRDKISQICFVTPKILHVGTCPYSLFKILLKIIGYTTKALYMANLD